MSPSPFPPPRAYPVQVRCQGAGEAAAVLAGAAEPLPSALEWRQVLVRLVYAPISPADMYSVRTGGLYGQESVSPPFVAGHDGVFVVSKIGPGVKGVPHCLLRSKLCKEVASVAYIRQIVQP